MQISSASSTTFDIRLTETLTTGAGGIGDRGGLSVELRGSDGRVGRGQTAPIPGMEGPGLEALAVDIDRWCASASGSPVDEALAALDSFAGSPLARFAIHTALADLASQDAGVPLAQWLRSGAPGSVRANGLVTELNPGAVHSHAIELVAQGATAIKLKVGVAESAQDVTRIIAASEAAGPNVSLRLDANGAWSRDAAERVIGRVGMHRVDYIEDPTSNPLEYPDIEAATGVAVALDIPITHDASSAIADANVSVAVVKPAAIGGVDRVIDLARTHPELRIIVTSSIDREVGLAAAIHAAAALPREEDAHGLSTGLLVRGMPDALLPRNGAVGVPSGPGVWTSEAPETT